MDGRLFHVLIILSLTVLSQSCATSFLPQLYYLWPLFLHLPQALHSEQGKFFLVVLDLFWVMLQVVSVASYYFFVPLPLALSSPRKSLYCNKKIKQVDTKIETYQKKRVSSSQIGSKLRCSFREHLPPLAMRHNLANLNKWIWFNLTLHNLNPYLTYSNYLTKLM